MIQDRLNSLLNKYHEGNLSTSEGQELNDWFHSLNLGGMEFETWANQEHYAENRFENFQARIRQDSKSARLVKIRWAAAAAAVLIGLSIGSYVFLHQRQSVQLANNDLLPGKNQATLTLANGQKIILTQSLNGKLAQQGNTSIQFNQNTGITYKGTGSKDMQYNTLSAARGEISPLPLILSDGTKVWLNAASSITYPVSFAANERKVTVTGEAYFEVVHNAAKPFIVFAGAETIRDIGTAFDVNAYTDEEYLRTTLVEGSVSVNGTVLKPGQQSELNSSKLSVNTADIDETLAWKNGMFRFSNEKLSEIMLQASRWYNVEVAYANEALKNKTFGVIGNRFAKASDLLHTLELTGEVKFTITGNKITVTQP